MSNLKKYALQEFKRAGYKPTEECKDRSKKWLQESVLELLDVFSNQGHSNFSAKLCVDFFTKLALFKPLTPITGNDDEWNHVADELYQNKIMHNVFKETGVIYRQDGIVMRDPTGCCYTSNLSKLKIKLPYQDKNSIYLDVNENAQFASLDDKKTWIPIDDAIKIIQEKELNS